MKMLGLGAAIVALSLFAGANAQAGNNVKFTIHNSSDYIISAFQTNDGDGWSTNWLGGDTVGAGENAPLEFTADGPCKIELRVSWRTTDGGQEVGEPWNIDICKATNVYFDGKKVTYE
jgi:hypothetical protein